MMTPDNTGEEIGAVLAARLLDMSLTGLRKHDDKLQPRRDHAARRLYRLAVIDEFAGCRTANRLDALRRVAP